MKRRGDGEMPDLFAAAGGAPSSAPAADAQKRVPSIMAIDSPLVGETREWLSRRAVTLGNLLSSERAAEYVACLRALAASPFFTSKKTVSASAACD